MFLSFQASPFLKQAPVFRRLNFLKRLYLRPSRYGGFWFPPKEGVLRLRRQDSSLLTSQLPEIWEMPGSSQDLRPRFYWV